MKNNELNDKVFSNIYCDLIGKLLETNSKKCTLKIKIYELKLEDKPKGFYFRNFSSPITVFMSKIYYNLYVKDKIQINNIVRIKSFVDYLVLEKKKKMYSPIYIETCGGFYTT